jgi:hypothetical protein
MFHLPNKLKSRLSLIGLVLIIILLSSSLIACISQDEYEKVVNERESYWRELFNANSTITDLNANKEQLENQVAQLNNDKRQLDEEKESLNAQLSTANSRIASLTNVVDDLTEAITPSPDHSISFTETQSNPDFMSVTWKGKDYELQQKVIAIGKQYHNSHTFIANETDCNDMAVDIWNMLFTQGIKSAIVIGSLEDKAATFKDSDHTWLYIFDADAKYFILEPTTGEAMFKDTGNNLSEKYLGGWLYKKPSDLWADLKKKW